MSWSHDVIRGAIARVRARWRMLRAFEAVFRGAAAMAAVVAVGLLVAPWADQAPRMLAALGVVCVVLAAGVGTWFVWPLRHGPSTARVARFIEEHTPELEDRLASATDVLDSGRRPSALAEPMLDDTARRLGQIGIAEVVPAAALGRAALMAATSVVALLLVLVAGRDRARTVYDAAALTLLPSRVSIDVVPGDARVRAGDAFAIEARIVGSRVPLVPRVAMTVGETHEDADMVGGSGEPFRHALGRVTAPFTYTVTAPGGLEAGPFSVEIVTPPRVRQIDVAYEYPRGLGLAPRAEEDSGDIYAPEGTAVRVRVHADRPATAGALELAEGGRVTLESRAPMMLEGALLVARNDAYRVVLSGVDGLASEGDVEYFIRALEDRAPEVRVTEPVGDRNVTSLEEVDITARADDDYGVARLELVYSVGGGPERVVPMTIPSGQTTVTGRQTIYLEALDVSAGDMLSYYVRARDVTRGKRPTVARSDIFFLEVRPFEQTFSLAQSQTSSGAAGDAISDLVNAQKDVVSATWKLDRRAERAGGAQSESDARAVARAEASLKTRVEQVASALGAGAMRDPRRAVPIGPESRVAIPQRPEEEAMTAASAAMGEAVVTLDRLDTAGALPYEMEALNQLLKAQGAAKDLQMSMGRGNGGRGNGNYDLSSLFDRELQRGQQTNYEIPEPGRRPEANEDTSRKLLDAIRALAERQDELMKKQRDLVDERLDESTRRRELERLTREQSELREQAERLAQSPGQQSESGRPGGSGQSRQGGQSGRGAQGEIRSASDAMRSAVNELRRQDPGAAGLSAGRALDALREMERRVAAGQSAAAQRSGEARLEARQLADAERRLAGELEALSQPTERDGSDPDTRQDRRRRIAAEQERLAGRAEVLGNLPGIEPDDVAHDMREAAAAVRAGAEAGAGRGGPAGDARTAEAQRGIARALEQAADRMAQGGADGDGAAGRLAGQMEALADVRERLDEVSRAIASLDQAADRTGRVQELSALRDEYRRQLERAERALAEAQRADPSLEVATGFTFEGQGMTLSSPGTDAFKQDFARWEALRRQADTALSQAESSLARALGAARSAGRLASGLDDRAPRDYQAQVDAYFKAIAERDR